MGIFTRGAGLQKSDLRSVGTPAIHYGQVHTHYGVWATETKSFVDERMAARFKQAQPGALVIATTSEDDAAVGKATAWLGAEPAAVSGDAHIFHHTLDPKFVSYFFQTADFQRQKQAHLTGAKVRRISADGLSRIRIPLPPLEIQLAIVEVLDTFRSLEAELEAELEARRRQYAHHRDTMVLDSAVQVPLHELGKFSRGRRFTKADVVETGIPSIHYGEIYTDYGVAAQSTTSHVRSELRPSLRYANTNDVIIAGVGETVEDVGKAVAWLGVEPVAYHDDCFAFTHDLNPKFVAYAMQTEDFHRQKDKYVSRAKVKRLSADGLGKILIPAPPRDEQDRIVDVLDSFDALVNDLSVGLPAELAARRKQYEYYRDKLLTFPEAS
ncbi:MAG: restriction endonuclease subunit S [Dermatophilaceae bacterium]